MIRLAAAGGLPLLELGRAALRLWAGGTVSKTATEAAIENVDGEIERLEAKLRKHGSNSDGAELNRLRIKKQDLQIRQFKREMARIARLPEGARP